MLRCRSSSSSLGVSLVRLAARSGLPSLTSAVSPGTASAAARVPQAVATVPTTHFSSETPDVDYSVGFVFLVFTLLTLHSLSSQTSHSSTTAFPEFSFCFSL